MSKIKVSLLLLTFLSVSIRSSAQNKANDKDVTIHFTQHSTWTDDNFEVDIEKKPAFIKVKYSILESPPVLAVRNDTAFKTLSIKLQSKNLTSSDEHKLHKEVNKLLERHTFHNKDSIILVINEHTTYNDLLMRFAKASKETLEKDNQSRIMDVDFTNCIIAYKGETKTIMGTVDQTVALNSAVIKFIKQTINLSQADKLATVLRIREKYRY
jgi:hypothetical protein